MAAIAVCLKMNIQPETISRAMQQPLSIPGRLEAIPTTLQFFCNKKFIKLEPENELLPKTRNFFFIN